MELLQLKLHYLSLHFFILVIWSNGRMLESVSILEKFVYEKSFPHTTAAINGNKLRPRLVHSLL